MSVVIESTPVRLQLGIVSNPPVAPVDRNTGDTPKIWAGASVALQIGIFTTQPAAVDLTNLAYLQVLIQDAQDSPFALVTKQINAVDIKKTIPIADWIAGTDQQATAQLDPADTDQALGGQLRRDFWIVVIGVTSLGAPIVYGGGTFTIEKPAFSLPAPNKTSPSRHRQATTVDDVTVTPASPFHTEIVDIGGAARTFNILLGINGAVDGAQLAVILNLPATADIIANVRNSIITNPVISTVATGNVLQALLEYYYDADLASWVPKFYALPPT